MHELTLLLLAILAGVSCHRGPAPAELEQVLNRVVPANGYAVSTPSYDAGAHSVFGVREFEVDMDCDAYREWVKRQLSADWNVTDGGAGDVMFTKYIASDAYFITANCMRAGRPARIHVIAQGIPN